MLVFVVVVVVVDVVVVVVLLLLFLSNEVMFLQCYYVVTWLVPPETAAVSAQVPCTPYYHVPIYSKSLHSLEQIHCAHVASNSQRVTEVAF